MGRILRVVVPGLPHHVTQRGNRRLPTFFQENDYRLYLTLLAEECRRCAVQLWAYCLMPNHAHLMPVPSTAAGLAAAIGETHRRYTTIINTREHWTGHLWQGQGRLAIDPVEETLASIRLHTRTARPLGNDIFYHCEKIAGRGLRTLKVGRPRKAVMEINK